MSREDYSNENLKRLFDATAVLPLGRSDPYVIFSDLHMGNGGRLDDFQHNHLLFESALRGYYLQNEFGLILNGDVEELERFSRESVRARWKQTYALFDSFAKRTALFRLVGNHDLELLPGSAPLGITEALRFRYENNDIFIFHGHQTKRAYRRPNRWIRVSLRYLANPLRIRNFSVSQDSLKQFKTERRVYRFASDLRIMSIIGHTHRPLFESMSKVDSIKFRVEQLCRAYPTADEDSRGDIESIVAGYQKELEGLSRRDRRVASTSSLYGANLVTPCMFNSGCVIGKRGMTCLEITRDNLAYIFSRIYLLSGRRRKARAAESASGNSAVII